jgi:hypothetical protein
VWAGARQQNGAPGVDDTNVATAEEYQKLLLLAELTSRSGDEGGAWWRARSLPPAEAAPHEQLMEGRA